LYGLLALASVTLTGCRAVVVAAHCFVDVLAVLRREIIQKLSSKIIQNTRGT
jgi:hypothetical protein